MHIYICVENSDSLHVFDAALKYLQTPGGKWIDSFPGVAVQERITISHDFAALLLSRGDSESNTVKGGFHQFPRNKNACSLTPSCASFPADVSQNPSDWVRMAKAMLPPQL